jgi:hypothetical protein
MINGARVPDAGNVPGHAAAPLQRTSLSETGLGHSGVGRNLTRQDAVEDIRRVSFEPTERGGSGVAGWPFKTVYIAFAVVHNFWPPWRPSLLSIDIERLALWRRGRHSRRRSCRRARAGAGNGVVRLRSLTWHCQVMASA